MRFPAKEDDILRKYPKVELHNIHKHRVCFSLNQLQNLLKCDKNIHSIFIGLCEKRFAEKNNLSLDFYDIYNLMQIATNSKITKDERNEDEDDENGKTKFKDQLKNKIVELALEKRITDLEKEVEKYKKEITNLKDFEGQAEPYFGVLEDRIRTLEERMRKIESTYAFNYENYMCPPIKDDNK